MAMRLAIVLYLSHISLLSSFFSEALADFVPDRGIDWWCGTTPHPEPCKYFMSRSRPHYAPRHKDEFRSMAVQVALERAVQAQSHAEKLGPRCHSRRKKAVWRDCCNLYANTIAQLNQTLQHLNHKNSTASEFDAQTWLSAALTSIQTCRAGSVELNVSDFISASVLSTNVSELISNSLAINGALMPDVGDDDYKSGFPKWVSKKERRLLQSSSLASRANLVVAKDGSGNFRTVQAAVNAAAAKKVAGNGRFIIYVKRGEYRENVLIGRNLNRIMLVGDGLRYTIITGSRYVKQGFTTYSSATVGVDGIGFMARGITFRNTAGPQNGQAVALRSASDLSVFYACSFEGYQDTLFVHAQRQFYKSCYIYGTVDFIFGNAAVVFQSCIIYVRKPLSGQANMITAQGRGDPYQNTGISIHNSRVLAASDLKPVVSSVKTYLGRPWQQYSRTVYLKTYMDSLVSPQGWSPWDTTNFALDTLYFGEYMNFGPGSSTANRVNWPGYRAKMTASEASRFTVGNFIAGRTWLPATGVPFTSGL